MRIEELIISLEEAYQKADVVKVATLFYAIGEAYLKEGKEEKALVYINWFDDLVGCDDDLYEQFQDKEEQASKWIALLEEKSSYAKEIREWVNEKDKELSKLQKMQWNLLTLARMNRLFLAFSEVAGFEVFNDIEEIIDLLVGGIYSGCDVEEEERLDDFLLDLEDSIDISTMINGKSKVKIKNGADFEALDLLEDNLYDYMMLVLYEIVDLLEGDEDKEISLDFVTNALHIGYYVRTSDKAMEEIIALTEERNRITEDYVFVKANPNAEEFAERIEAYKKLFLPVH